MQCNAKKKENADTVSISQKGNGANRNSTCVSIQDQHTEALNDTSILGGMCQFQIKLGKCSEENVFCFVFFFKKKRIVKTKNNK